MRMLYADHLLERLQFLQEGSLQQRLLNCMQSAIIDGIFPHGGRLPPTRDMARELGVSRNTVLHVYESLMAQGYVTARTGSGTWIAETLPETCLHSHAIEEAQPAAAQLSATLSKRGASLLGHATASPYQWGAFVPGAPDVTEFPHKLFSQIQARLNREPDVHRLVYSSGGGCPDLRHALAAYLRVARSVRADADQILITEGVHQAVDLVTRVLCDQGDRVWMEEPGYWGTRNLLRMNGLTIRAMAVDEQGMVPEVGPPPKMIFVTPSHQYPLGVHLSLARRKALLNLARKHKSWIVEDDYDSEFRFSGQPYPSLQGLEADAPVIYMGTFSKTLYPALRIGYMVVPKQLAEPLRIAAAELYRGGHLLIQRALAEFIRQGHYMEHIRRMRLLYRQRRQFLCRLIERYLGPGFLPPVNHEAGLHLVVHLPANCDDVAIAALALRRGVKVRPLSQYYMHQQEARGLLLGYACVNEKQCQDAFGTLKACLTESGIAVQQQG
ncbi:PLP-dependent aminotransferase family protein [Duffyella gerundensis]|uniref:MocR-like pyridoxine biosynthesis transcription factor PdxR n=1 Tax=Duffyella gerundensis TaxID=1619313 RepID=UPI001AE2101A|nr:PLP-dependent aminotransferase family protein [Duffyella gerundensis]QTO55842.1 PLP-dependent aminotransferase family protein [Duffyella gerundensis]